MLAVTVHAKRVLPEIDRLAKAEGLQTASMGTKIGDAFSVVRDLVVDRTMNREKSYRSTLLGLRHGVDLVRLLFASARADGGDQIVTFCQAWLEERTPLVEAAASQLDWFGANPSLALESATGQLGKRRGRRPGRRQKRAHETSIIPRRRR